MKIFILLKNEFRTSLTLRVFWLLLYTALYTGGGGMLENKFLKCSQIWCTVSTVAGTVESFVLTSFRVSAFLTLVLFIALSVSFFLSFLPLFLSHSSFLFHFLFPAFCYSPVVFYFFLLFSILLYSLSSVLGLSLTTLSIQCITFV